MHKEKISGIYCIENLVNGKKYIGLSLNIDKRKYMHLYMLKRNKHINEHLQSSWNKYGEVNFTFYIIEENYSKDELIKMEIYFINKYKASDKRYGYNKTSGGEGTKDKTKDILEKMSKNRTRRGVIQIDLNGNFVEKHRNCKFASESVKGRVENIRNCCNKKYGSKSVYGYMWMYEDEYKTNCKYNYNIDTYSKHVLQYDLNNNFIAEYESARECERQIGIGYKMISRVCNGGRPYTHGYIFKFKEI